MSKELDKCSMERDKYKILVEQFKCKKHLQSKTDDWDGFTPTNISSSEILARTKEHNNMLKVEVNIKNDETFINFLFIIYNFNNYVNNIICVR